MNFTWKAYLGKAMVALVAAGALLPIAQAQSVQGVTNTEIVLGTHQDLSGPISSIGSYLRDGLQLAADDINAAGGIHGRKIRLIVEDSGFDPKKAVLATQKLVNQDKVFALIAPLGSAPVQASMNIALEQDVPLLFAGTPADFTYKPFHKLKFGLAVPYGEQVRAMTKYAVEKMGKKKFGVLYQDDETGQNVLRAVEEQLKVHGMAVAERASYKRGEVDFSSQISRLKAANVDVVVLGTIVRETASAKMEARKQGWPVDMMVSQAGMYETVIKIAGEAAEGLYAMAQYLPIRTQEQTPQLQAVVKRYKDKFNKEPDDGIVYGYLAMSVFAEGARNAGKTLTPDTLAKGLEQVKNFKTVFAATPVSYGPNERLGSRSAILTQVKGGKFVPITGTLDY
ncbi:MAG TPA: ABC transporter substrate-binding protein [Noviherbaspirillum sp.]|nr:ABC transporter substrate-binding protein [Noviherbaspirillum sp.]